MELIAHNNINSSAANRISLMPYVYNIISYLYIGNMIQATGSTLRSKVSLQVYYLEGFRYQHV